ncbi:MAG TPA: prepilin-type N-terminal cleavage/methylation domain-containing protein [Planctomycetota bacterium]|nr:prepilin-type N-terminal cleavage/methylation domain-containing protein [Planctomycetota bacterium]
MVRQLGSSRRAGVTLIEVVTVLAVLGVLLGTMFSAFTYTRYLSRVTVAANNLRQMAVGFEAFFLKNHAYPKEGSDLAATLGPFLLNNTGVFSNPLAEEAWTGQVVSRLYARPALRTLDAPHNYITSMCDRDGRVIMVLNTGGEVERWGNMEINPDTPQRAYGLFMIWGRYLGEAAPPLPETPPPPPSPPGVVPPPSPPGSTITRGISIGPSGSNGSKDWDFELVKLDGSVITRDMLQASKGKMTYEGEVSFIRVRPKGNANENDLMVDGEDYSLKNGSVYTFQPLEGGKINVRLFNEQGKGMGQWQMYIDATGTQLTEIN